MGTRVCAPEDLFATAPQSRPRRGLRAPATAYPPLTPPLSGRGKRSLSAIPMPGFVIPTKVGIHGTHGSRDRRTTVSWIPASAGMTIRRRDDDSYDLKRSLRGRRLRREEVLRRNVQHACQAFQDVERGIALASFEAAQMPHRNACFCSEILLRHIARITPSLEVATYSFCPSHKEMGWLSRADRLGHICPILEEMSCAAMEPACSPA